MYGADGSRFCWHPQWAPLPQWVNLFPAIVATLHHLRSIIATRQKKCSHSFQHSFQHSVCSQQMCKSTVFSVNVWISPISGNKKTAAAAAPLSRRRCNLLAYCLWVKTRGRWTEHLCREEEQIQGDVISGLLLWFGPHSRCSGKTTLDTSLLHDWFDGAVARADCTKILAQVQERELYLCNIPCVPPSGLALLNEPKLAIP